MRGGAPHEAERGLSTAMDRLKEPDRSEALLLLGEALQEQGRMRESIPYLDAVGDGSKLSVLSRRNVLRLYAHKFGDSIDSEASRRIGLQLLQESKEAVIPNTRLRALWIAASLIRENPEASLLDAIRKALHQEDPLALSLEDRGEFALGMALCHYFSGEQARGLEVINGIIGDLESHKIRNSVYLTLLLGLCAIHGGLGEYDTAVAYGERGVRVAREMGEERRLRIFASNIALFHSRLGNPDAQISWAAKAWEDKTGSRDRILDQKLHYIRAQAHAIRGEVDEALSALAAGAAASANLKQPWVRQMWQLRHADVLTLVGRGREAVNSARLAFAGDLRELQTPFLAGPFARWSARLGVGDTRRIEETRTRLRELLRREHELDCIDQAEVLNAKVWFDSKTGIVDKREFDAMWAKLGRLPIGATNELRAMGMLDF